MYTKSAGQLYNLHSCTVKSVIADKYVVTHFTGTWSLSFPGTLSPGITPGRSLFWGIVICISTSVCCCICTCVCIMFNFQ